MTEVYKYKGNGDGTYNIQIDNVKIPFKNLEMLTRGLGTEVELKFIDPDDISHKQRKLIFALLGDIEEHTGDPVEYRRHRLTLEFMAYKNIDEFSLSNCSMTDAREFIEFILTFIFRNNIPITYDTSDLLKEDKAFLYYATINRKCVICGEENAQLAHHYHIGRGMNRNKMDHYGYEVLALCHKHHRLQHNIGIRTFDKKYALEKSWIKVDERLNKMLKGQKYEEN